MIHRVRREWPSYVSAIENHNVLSGGCRALGAGSGEGSAHASTYKLVRLGLAHRRGSRLLMQVPLGPLALSSQPVLGYPWVFTLPRTSENEPLSPGKICTECGIALNS